MNTRPDAMDWMMAAICVGGVLLTWLGLAVVIGMMINLARAIVMVALNWIDARAEREEMKARRARSVRLEGNTRLDRVGRGMGCGASPVSRSHNTPHWSRSIDETTPRSTARLGCNTTGIKMPVPPSFIAMGRGLDVRA